MPESDTGLYARHIGRPRTSDEVRGYWLFVVGLIAGVIGILLFLPSGPASSLREASIALGGVGLALLVAGPVIRLPLRQVASYTTYLGLVACLLAVVWFLLVFPSGWSVQTGNTGVIGLYAIGMAIIGIGGVLIPLLTEATAATDEATAEAAAARDSERAEREQVEKELVEEQAARERLESELAEERERGELEAETAAADVDRLEAELASLRKSQAQFEIYEDANEKWRWRLRHRNGNIIASSGQGYTRKHNARKGMQSVRANTLGAAVIEVATLPDDEESVPMLADLADSSAATFEVYEDNAEEWRWRLVHENGNVLADSGEGYTRRRDVERAIESVKHNVGPATYLQFDPTSFEIYRDGAGEWRWRLVHKNGNILADSGEGYTRRRDARRAVDSIREGVADATVEAEE